MTIVSVTKRNGDVVPFDDKKIIQAIHKAALDVERETGTLPLKQRDARAIAAYVYDNAKQNGGVSVEEIQNQVEYLLDHCPDDAAARDLSWTTSWDTSRQYVRYRYLREIVRERQKLNSNILEITDGVNQEVLDENSNKNPVIFSTQRDYIAGEVSRDISNRILLPPEVAAAHLEGAIHVHDTDYMIQRMHNCCVWNLEDIFTNGTVINGTLIERPHSFSTACNIATQIMAIIASCQYGGQTMSVAHLVPFVEVSRQRIRAEVCEEHNVESTDPDLEKIVDTRLKKEIKRGVQVMQYQINTISSSNGQTPFVTLWMSLSDLNTAYARDDMAIVCEEILKQRIQGVKNEAGQWVTPAFPKLVYGLSELNVYPGTPYYWLTELAAKCTAKRMVPDYVSEKMEMQLKYPIEQRLPAKQRRDLWGDESIWGRNPFKNLTDFECDIIDKYVLHPEDMSVTDAEYAQDLIDECQIRPDQLKPACYPPMGCRSFLTPDPIHFKHYGRFNQGVVTVNLPWIALLAREQAEKNGTDAMTKFWEQFDHIMEICHTGLRCRHERLLGTVADASPTHWLYGALARKQKGETIDNLLYDNYSTISLGYAGLYECTVAMTGKSHTEPAGEEFAFKVLQEMNTKCAEWRAAENISYSLYGTPIESTTAKFATALQKRFGIVKDVSDYPYITNSYHVNVREEIDPFRKLEFEARFQHMSPGGAISYIETGHLENNIEAVIAVIQYIYEHILYAELNIKSDACQVCGYEGEINIENDPESGRLIWKCPNCGNTDQSKMNVARRTCGYIGSKYWNQGRTAEIRDRVVHLA